MFSPRLLKPRKTPQCWVCFPLGLVSGRWYGLDQTPSLYHEVSRQRRRLALVGHQNRESGGAHRLRWSWRAVLRMKPLLLRQTRNLTATLKQGPQISVSVAGPGNRFDFV